MTSEDTVKQLDPTLNPPAPTGPNPGSLPEPKVDPPTNSLQAPSTPKRKAPPKRNKPRPTTRAARGKLKGA